MSSNKPTVPTGAEFIAHAEALLIGYDKLREEDAARMAERAPEDRRVLTARQRGLVPARNGLCPCGSGNKYKRCCRRVVAYVGVPAHTEQLQAHAAKDR